MAPSTRGIDVFDVLADPTRRRILELLARGERTVLELLKHFRLRQPTVSRHLRVLREAGLVGVRADGRYRRYRLTGKPLQSIDQWLERFEPFWNEKLDSLGAYLHRKHGPVAHPPEKAT